MKELQVHRLVALCALCFAVCAATSAQEVKCDEIIAMANIARASSVGTLNAWLPRAGTSYRARLVVKVRSFELRPTDTQAAADLLGLIPKNDTEESVWHEFSGYLCQAEAMSDIKVLSRLGERLPRDLANAVLLVPERMFDYVSHAYDSIQDPDSDYAVQMRKVCRARRKQFVDAVNQLSPKDKAWFISKIFDPESCRTIAFPEQ